MQRGELVRTFQVQDEQGGRLFSIEAKRFVSMSCREIAALSYSITLEKDPLQKKARVKLAPYLQGNVVNEDANYGEDFWLGVKEAGCPEYQLVAMETKKIRFSRCRRKFLSAQD